MKTLQEIFDFGLTHIRKQGRPGTVGQGETGCAYLTPEGCKCIVGGFIQDPSVLGDDLNTKAVGSIIRAAATTEEMVSWHGIPVVAARAFVAELAKQGVDIDAKGVRQLLYSMQNAHDHASSALPGEFMVQFEREMVVVARSYGLLYTPPQAS